MTISQDIAEVPIIYLEDELENLTEKQIRKIFASIAAKCYNLVQRGGIHPNKLQIFFPPQYKRYWNSEVFSYQLVIDKPPFVALVTKH